MAIQASGGVLASLRGPEELRRLGPGELAALAEDLRAAVVDTVTANGGHLGSNLGIVELTIALHRVFESPRDALLFDTGHQCYPHKLLTGRLATWGSLRTAGGLSGYPSRDESEHDWIENSHASTAPAYAHGLAVARRWRGQAGHVVTVIGDGALTGGMAYEGLANLGAAGLPVVVVLNDNGRSYAPTVSPLQRDAGACRGFVEALGFDYVGPVDGHDIAALEVALQWAAGTTRPCLVHVRTEKGKGHAPAEQDAVKRLHDTSTMHPDSFTAAFSSAMVDLGARRPDVVAITAAMPDSTGLLAFGAAFPDRLVDVGIAEQHAVTAAAGMAMGGLVPIVAIYATFLTRAFDQVSYDVGLHRLPVVFCLDRAGITGDDGASHNGVLDLVLLSKVPGMRVLSPATPAELPALLEEAVALATGPVPGPVAIRWSKVVPDPTVALPAATGSSPRRLRRGDDVCLVAGGHLVVEALAAADLLAVDGITATVWDPRCLAPLDVAVIGDAARHPLVVTVEDGYDAGGMGSAVAQRLAALPTPPGGRRVEVAGIPLRFLEHDRPAALQARLGLDARGIADRVRSALAADRRARPGDVIDLTGGPADRSRLVSIGG